MAGDFKTQADKRKDMNVFDQFGRKWLVAIDRETFEPTSQVLPARWSDPLATPMKYLRVPKEPNGDPVLGKLEVDFAGWINDQGTAEREWKLRLWNIGREQQKNAFDPARAEEDEYLLHLVGPKPWPSAAVLLRASRGDKVLLGLAPLDKATRLLIGRLEFEDIVGHGDAMLPGQGEDEDPLAAQGAGALPLNTGDEKAFMAACLHRGLSAATASQMWSELRGEAKQAAAAGAPKPRSRPKAKAAKPDAATAERT